MAEFVLGPLSGEGGRLCRSWREGKVSGEGFLDDYANVAHGLIELHVATGDVRWLREAHRLALLAVELFHDPEHGGFFLARRAARSSSRARRGSTTTRSRLATRCSPTCSCGSPDLGRRRAGAARRLGAPARGADARPRPGAFGWGLCALDLHLSPARELAMVGPVDSPVARAALAPFQPNTVVAVGPPPASRCSRERGSSTGSPRCTSASASSARRPSPTLGDAVPWAKLGS